MLLEIKTRGSQLKSWQHKLFSNLDKWLSKGIEADWQYLGFHTIIFENIFLVTIYN
jgi:hypothetical protein